MRMKQKSKDILHEVVFPIIHALLWFGAFILFKYFPERGNDLDEIKNFGLAFFVLLIEFFISLIDSSIYEQKEISHSSLAFLILPIAFVFILVLYYFFANDGGGDVRYVLYGLFISSAIVKFWEYRFANMKNKPIEASNEDYQVTEHDNKNKYNH